MATEAYNRSNFERFNFPVLRQGENGESCFEVTRRAFSPDDPSYRLRLTISESLPKLPRVAFNQVITEAIARVLDKQVEVEPVDYIEALRTEMSTLEITPQISVHPINQQDLST
jgi:hypothetical protein